MIDPKANKPGTHVEPTAITASASAPGGKPLEPSS